MNKGIHTPGPWKWDKERDQILSDHEDHKGSIICKIATGENKEEEDANAQLIADAPALLQEMFRLVEEGTAASQKEIRRLNSVVAHLEGQVEELRRAIRRPR